MGNRYTKILSKISKDFRGNFLYIEFLMEKETMQEEMRKEKKRAF